MVRPPYLTAKSAMSLVPTARFQTYSLKCERFQVCISELNENVDKSSPDKIADKIATQRWTCDCQNKNA